MAIKPSSIETWMRILWILSPFVLGLSISLKDLKNPKDFKKKK